MTLSILNGFAKFVHWQILWKIGDKTVVKDATTFKSRHYTTL